MTDKIPEKRIAILWFMTGALSFIVKAIFLPERAGMNGFLEGIGICCLIMGTLAWVRSRKLPTSDPNAEKSTSTREAISRFFIASCAFLVVVIELLQERRLHWTMAILGIAFLILGVGALRRRRHVRPA